MSKRSQVERERATESLREALPEGTTVYCIVTKVAPSGMSRHIRFKYVKGGRILDATARIGIALGYTYKDDTHSLLVRGCGMDMGYHVVEGLSFRLYGIGDNKLRHEWL